MSMKIIMYFHTKRIKKDKNSSTNINPKRLIFLIIFLCTIPVAQSLEYNEYSEPVFSIEDETLIKSISFCFEYDDEILCRQVGDFKDDTLGVSCDYLMFVRSIDVIHYHFRCELIKPKKICPLVLNLNKWPQKIVTDDFEVNLVDLNEDYPINNFPFVLSGYNKCLYFPENEEYEYYLSKSGKDYILKICSKKSKNLHESSIEMVAISSELNRINFHNNPSISIYENPPTSTFGPEETIGEIEIVEFFTGKIFEWHPELPYANLAMKIYSENKSYDKNETLVIKFKSTSGIEIEQLPYDTEHKRWVFPELGTRQIAFDYNSWFFPISKYTTKIIVENNISLTGNQSLRIPNSEFLYGIVGFDKNEIKIEISHNWLCYLLLIIILAWFFIVLVHSFSQIIHKTKIPTATYFLQLIPFGSIFVKDLVPIESILFFIFLLSYACFWLYFLYTKYKRS